MGARSYQLMYKFNGGRECFEDENKSESDNVLQRF